MRACSIFLRMFVCLFICYAQLAFASEELNKKNSIENTKWPFLTLSKTRGNEYSAQPSSKKSTTCPNNTLFVDIFSPIYSIRTEIFQFDINIYELRFTQNGEVIDPKANTLTGWYGEYLLDKDGIAKITLLKKGCTEPVEFGYYNQKTQRLCSRPDETMLSHKKYRELAGHFDACTEWAKVLKDPRKKVIDITSYGDDEFGDMPGGFMGFLRFTDKPKPVVGLDDKTLYCFLNCPSGKPGIIQKP